MPGAVRYKKETQSGDDKCRNTDAGGIDLDADAQL
jgi:hypothetical protein